MIIWRTTISVLVFTNLFYFASLAIGLEYSDQGSHEFLGEQTESISVTNATTLTYRGSLSDDQCVNARVFQVLADSKLIVETEGELAQNYRQCEQLVPFFEIDSSAVEILAGDFATDGLAAVATNMSHVLLEGGTFLAQGESAQGITLSNSALSVNGGTLRVASEFPSAVILKESSVMTMTSGNVWSSAVDMGNVIAIESGRFEMTGGTLEGSGVVFNHIISANAGEIDIHGGTIQGSGGAGGGSGLHLRGTTIANITGGLIDQSYSTFTPPSNRHAAVDVGGDSQIHISGGSIVVNVDDDQARYSAISVKERATLVISGGSIFSSGGHGGTEPFDIVANDESRVTLVGSEFNYAFNEPITDEVGSIQGILQDGSIVDLSFERSPGAVIILVPEPASTIPLLLSFLLIAARHCGQVRHQRRSMNAR